MDTFGHIRNILSTKKPMLVKDDSDFSPYLIQRWISMSSPELAYVMNETINSIWLGMNNDKQMWYDAFLALTPRIGYKRIDYMKKDRKEPSKDVSDLARLYQVSCREIEEMLEIDPDLLGNEKTVEVYRKTS